MRNVPSKLNSVNNVGKGNKAWVKLQNGPKYLELIFVTNYPAADLEKITIDLGGVHQQGEIIECTGTDLKQVESYRNDKYSFARVAPHIYVLQLGNQEANTDVGQLFTGLVTLQTDNVLVNVHIKSASAVADNDAFIDMYAESTEPSVLLGERDEAGNVMRQTIPMLKPHTVTNNKIGEVDYFTLPDEAGLEYRRLFVSGGAISEIELKKDGTTKYEETSQVAEFQQARQGRVPQAGVFVVDFVRRGWVMTDTFKPQHNRELRMRMKVTVAQNIRVLVDGFVRLAQAQR